VTSLAQHPGDVLVFLPGIGDIRSVQRRLLAAKLPGPPVAVLPLHGMLSPAEQDEALRPQHGAQR
jgi:ATP-dependent helicase HrpB